MEKRYKIFEVSTARVDPEQHQQGYDAPEIIFPTVLRSIYQERWSAEDTFDTLEEVEKYLEENLIEEYGNTYTILTQYSYDRY